MIHTKRLNYIDALRALAIFMVVVSHVSNRDFGIRPYDSYWNHFICTFYLPLFFFISGFLSFKNVQSFKEVLKFTWRKFLSLMVPLFAFFCIRGFVNGDYFPLRMIFVYDGMIYWFCLVLFEFFVTYYLICYISHLCVKRIDYRVSLSLLLIIVSVILIACLVYFRNEESRFWNVACMENYTKYFQFFSFGVIFKMFEKRSFKIISSPPIKFLIILGFSLASIIIWLPQLKNNFLVYSFVHDELVRYLGVLTMFIIFYDNSHFFDLQGPLQKFILLIGCRSLDIYLLEGFFHFNLSKYLNPILANNSNFALEIVLSIVLASIIVSISLFVSKLLRTSDFLSKILFGNR